MIYSKDDVKRMLDWLTTEAEKKSGSLSWGWPATIVLADLKKIIAELETKI